MTKRTRGFCGPEEFEDKLANVASDIDGHGKEDEQAQEEYIEDFRQQANDVCEFSL